MSRIAVMFPHSKEKNAFAAYTTEAGYDVIQLVNVWRHQEQVHWTHADKAWVHFDNAATGEHAWYYARWAEIVTIIVKELQLGYLENNLP